MFVMKITAVAVPLALLHTLSVLGSSTPPWQPWQPWGSQPMSVNQGVPGGESSQQQFGGLSVWQQLPMAQLPLGMPAVQHPLGMPIVQQPLGMPVVQQPLGVPAVPSIIPAIPQGAPTPLLRHQQFGGREPLVQQRTRTPTRDSAAVKTNPQSVLAAPITSYGSGNMHKTNTWRALQDLRDQVFRMFQRPSGAASRYSLEVVIPAENIMNTLKELSRLTKSVVDFCEEERAQKGPQKQLGKVGKPMFHANIRADRFPVDAYVKQGTDYAARLTDHFRALKKLLSVLWNPSADKAIAVLEVQQFRQTVSDSKEVYQLGSQMANASVGAVLPYVNTCSFFSKTGSRPNPFKLWSLVSARITSTMRYLSHVVDVLRKLSGVLVELTAGKVEPQSILDFARTRPIIGATNYLQTAEARSLSAVRYFNDLVTAFNAHTQTPSSELAQSEAQSDPITLDEQIDDNQQTLDDAVNAEFSLMAEDVVEDVEPVQVDGAPFSFEDADAMQTNVEESAAQWTPRRPSVDSTPEQPDDMMQTVRPDD